MFSFFQEQQQPVSPSSPSTPSSSKSPCLMVPCFQSPTVSPEPLDLTTT